MANLNSLGGIHYEMMRRCYNPKSVMWKWYGEKGIGVCEEWHDREVFKKWARDNGYEKGMRLERRNSEKDYSPENCYFGEDQKLKRGRKMSYRKRAKINSDRKREVGVENYKDSRLSHILGNIMDRCYNPNCDVYYLYGERGIKVCEEWKKPCGEGRYNFFKWALENGWEELDDPTIQTIDRIDPNGDYCPNNCRLITLQEQQRNKRNTVKHNYHGEYLLLSEIARKENIRYDSLRVLVNVKGYSAEQAVSKILKRK